MSTPSSPILGCSTASSSSSSTPPQSRENSLGGRENSLGGRDGSSNNNGIALRSSIGGISSGISKISLYSKETKYILTCDVDRQREINEAEQLFQSMPELSYNVTKINQWGKHQKRVLRLTNKGIANVRNDVVSSLYEYSDVRAIYLRDSEVFVLEYNGASHNYVYKSSIGYQIVQEITSRLNMRRTTDKKKHGFDIAMEYQKKLKQLNQQQQHHLNIGEGGSSSPPMTSNSSISRSLSFDSEDTSSISSSSSPPPGGAGDGSGLGEHSDGEDSTTKRPALQKRASKVTQLLGNTEEQRLQAEVDRITLSPHSNERKQIQQFLNNFNVLLKNPATVVMIVRQFIDTTKQSILNDSAGQISRLSSSVDSGFASSDEKDSLSITTIVEKNLEKIILLPLHKKLYSVISQQVQKEEQILQENIAKLVSKPQQFFGIKDEFITPSNWKSAVLELSCLDRCEIPHHKLDTILASARSIYNSINYEKRQSGNEDFFLSADDFLPIYLYVVVNSGVKDLEFTNQYLWQLCDPDKLGGEGGYYLTVFSSTLSLIRSLKMDNVEQATILDDLIPSITLSNSSGGGDGSSITSDAITEDDISDNEDQGDIIIVSNNNNNNHSNSNILSGSWNSAYISKKERTLSLSLGDTKPTSSSRDLTKFAMLNSHNNNNNNNNNSL